MSDWQPWLFLHSLPGIWRKWDLPYQTKFGGVTKFGVTPKYFGNIVYDVFICIYTDRCIHVYRCSSQCWVQKLCWSCCLKFSSHHNSPASFFNDISRFDMTCFVFSTSCSTQEHWLVKFGTGAVQKTSTHGWCVPIVVKAFIGTWSNMI